MTDGRLAIVLHSHMPYVEGFGDVAVRRGVAVGGDRDVLPAAARPAARGRAGDALADAGAVRPARGARCDRALPRLPARHAPGVARARHRGGRRLRAWRPSSSARAGEYARRAASAYRRTCSPRSRRSRRGRAPRRTRSCRCWPPTPACACRSAPGSSRTARASATAGAAASGCRSAPRAVAHALLEEASVRATCVDLTDVFGPAIRAPAPAGHEAAAARAHRSRDVDLSGRRAATPRTRPTATTTTAPARPPPVGQRRRRLRPGARGRAGGGRRRRLRRRVARRVRDGGLCVCALDTELLGHWWHEGPQWLELVVDAGDAAAGSSSSASTTRWPTAIRPRPARPASA